jgi:Ca2+-binding RTX toxin-like protein
MAIFEGTSGPDSLAGGEGQADSLLGLEGNDTLEGEAAGAIARYRASAPASGQADGASDDASLSFDGLLVAFASGAGNLAAGDSNGQYDVFVRSLATGTTVAATAGGNGQSLQPALSADGYFVAYQSAANNLVADDTNGHTDVFRTNPATGQTVRVSVPAGGGQADAASRSPAISGDGRYVAFESEATNLSDLDADAWADVFVADLQTGALALASRAPGEAADGASTSAAIAVGVDGTVYVAYASNAGNLVADDDNGRTDVFVTNLRTGATARVSAPFGAGGVPGDSGSPSIAVRGDRVVVAFTAAGSDVYPGDTNGVADVFVVSTDLDFGDRSIGWVSSGIAGPGNGASFSPSISADGSRVAFGSLADNLVAGDANGVADVFVKDLGTGALVRVAATDGAQPDGAGSRPSISGDGQRVAFTSAATNLAGADTNGLADVYAAVLGDAAVADTLVGGPGDDLFLVHSTRDTVVELPGEGVDAVHTDLARYTLPAGVERLVRLGSGSFVGAGNDGANTLVGGGGDDRLDGGLGPDRLQGGPGNDRLEDLDGAGTMLGEAGNDTLAGGFGPDSLDGGDGNDRLDGYWGYDTVRGGAGDDTVSEMDGGYLTGDAGDDLVDGGFGADSIDGGDGDDTLRGQGGNDTMLGGAGADTLDGGDGDDELDGGEGDDTLVGGEGRDTVSYRLATGGLVIDLGRQTAAGSPWGPDHLEGIENVFGSAQRDQVTGDGAGNLLDGGEGDDTLEGGGGDDTLLGSPGDDILIGGWGDDTLDGGDGADTADYSDERLDVAAVLGSPGSAAVGDYERDTLWRIRHLAGGTGRDSLTGDEDPNRLDGGADEDTLDGGAGNDTLRGGTEGDLLLGGAGDDGLLAGFGDDRLDGGEGDDELDGDLGNDTLDGGSGDDRLFGGGGYRDVASYESAGSPVSVNLGLGTANGGGGRDTLDGIEDLTGSPFDDLLVGNGERNVLRGGAGDDTLSGGGGDDDIDGGDGFDRADYDGAFGNIVVDLAAGTVGGTIRGLISGIEEVFGGVHHDRLIGDAQANGLRGRGGDDTLEGADGDDTLYGGSGDDTLYGGIGIDVASFDLPLSSAAGARLAGEVTIADTGPFPAQGTDTLTGVERLRFADAVVAIDTLAFGDNAFDVVAMFHAAMRALPSPSDLAYFLAPLDADPARGVADVANAMLERYVPGGVGDEALVAFLYQQLFGEPAAPALVADLAALIGPGQPFPTQADLCAAAAALPVNTERFVSLIAYGVLLPSDWYAT